MPFNKSITVSLIIPVYNRQVFLDKALNSVLSQTVLPDEIIVVDDNSLKPIRIAKEYKKINIILLRNEINLGTSASRNIGINYSSSNYCAFLDSDDLLSSRKIEFQKRIAEKFNSDFIYGSNIIVSDKKTFKAEFRSITNKNSYQELIDDFPFPNTSTLFISKSFLKKIGGFDETLDTCEDHDLWFKAAHNKAKFYGCEEAKTYFVQHFEERLSLDVLKRINSIPKFTENRRKEGMNLFNSFIFSNKYFARIFLIFIFESIKYKSFKIFPKIFVFYFNYPLSFYFIMKNIFKKVIFKISKKKLSK